MLLVTKPWGQEKVQAINSQGHTLTADLKDKSTERIRACLCDTGGRRWHSMFPILLVRFLRRIFIYVNRTNLLIWWGLQHETTLATLWLKKALQGLTCVHLFFFPIGGIVWLHCSEGQWLLLSVRLHAARLTSCWAWTFKPEIFQFFFTASLAFLDSSAPEKINSIKALI